MVFGINPVEAQILTKLALAMSLGILIGLERELKLSPVGMNTYPLVALGAALFGIIAFEINTAIASGVITGVGFLGAGTIFRAKRGVRGITTATMIWMSAAIGLSVGFHMYAAAVFTTILAFVLLLGVAYLEKNYVERLAEELKEREKHKKKRR